MVLEWEVLDSEEGSRPDYGDFSPRALLVAIVGTISLPQLACHA